MSDLVAELETINLGDQRLNRRARRVLCIQDTTELDYTGKDDIEGLGPLNYETRRGLYLHPMIAVTPERLCLGVLDAWSWVREPGSLGEAKGQRPLPEKESLRWLEGYQRVCELQASSPETELIYMGDREADSYEIFAEHHQTRHAQGGAAEWLIRAEHDRCLSDGRKPRAAAAQGPVLARVEFDLPASEKRQARSVVQTPRAVRVTPRAPYRCGQRLPEVEVTALLAHEENPPPGVEALSGLLLTSLPMESAEQALEVQQSYLCRWQIELFFKILKSGCKIEELQLEHLERLEPALALYLIIAWRVLYLTLLGRTCPELPCDVVFAEVEWQAVYVVTKRRAPSQKPPSLDTMIRMIAGYGGFLNRHCDGFPGSQTLWIGLQRCRDFVLAMEAQWAADQK